MTDVNPGGAPGRTALLAGLLALACAGCGGSGDRPRGPAPHRTTGGSERPAPSRTPGFPSAADGTNVSACRDGACEILVTKRQKIPLAPQFGYKAFSFDPADSTWRTTYTGGGSGRIRFLEPPYSGEWSSPTGKKGLRLTVVASDGKRAVIRLSPSG